MATHAPDTYYTSRKDKLLKQFRKHMDGAMPSLAERYGETKATALCQRSLVKFEELIPEIPYVGGGENDFSIFLLQSAWGLAYYRAMLEHGGTLEEMGEFIIEDATRMYRTYPTFVRHILGRLKFTKRARSRAAESARKSQERRYPGDWARQYVESDGASFDYGIDMVECGIVKFMEAQGAPELVPYFCETDFAMAEAFGMRLQRTTTLAKGCDRCNFRFSSKGR